MVRTPSWVSFSSINLARSIAPREPIAARIGWPCSPNKSQKMVGTGFVGVIFELDVLCAFFQERLRLAFGGDAGEVALDVGGENGNAVAREALGENLQRHRLSRSGRARNEAVPVRQIERKHLRLHALSGENPVLVSALMPPPMVVGASILEDMHVSKVRERRQRLDERAKPVNTSSQR